MADQQLTYRLTNDCLHGIYSQAHLGKLYTLEESVDCLLHDGMFPPIVDLGVMTPEKPHRIREGVYYHEPSGCDLFFVTIRKNERDYSPSTLYRDYALSQKRFHWESQNTTRAESPSGKRYQSHIGKTHALFFVRESAKDDRGHIRPYLFLGPAHYCSHVGERPMAITWDLKIAIPEQFYHGLGFAA